MEKILQGVITSTTLKDGEKEKVVRMIQQSGSRPHMANEVKAMLRTTVSLWLNKKYSTDSSTICKTIFSSYATNNVTLMSEILISELVDVVKDLEDGNTDVVAFCDLLRTSLQILHIQDEICADGNDDSLLHLRQTATASFQTFIKTNLSSHLVSLAWNNFRGLSHVVALLSDYSTIIIPWDSPSPLLVNLIVALCRTSPDLNVIHPKELIHEANQVSRLIKTLWSKASSPKMLIMESLQTIFTMISSTADFDAISVALSSVLQSVPESMIEDVCEGLIKDKNVSDGQMSNSLRHMIDWLKWPKHVNIHIWVTRIARGLAEAGRQVVLFEIVDETILSVASKLHYTNIQSTTFQVLATLLLYHQNCAQAFHKSIPLILSAFDKIENSTLLENLSELVQVLMYIHPGYPELYNDLLARISDYEVLSESYIQDVVKKYSSAVSSHHISMLSKSSPLVRQTDKVGLENLGNTCFLNAVMQALYNVDVLQWAMLTSELSSVLFLSQLQKVFASLHSTERATVNPSQYVKVCWPSWFVSGQQQDSSEYLRFLLDNIHEQCQGSRAVDDVTGYFTGSDTVITKCHNCSTETQRQQKFYDISLHFPDGSLATDQPISLEQMMDTYLHTSEELCGPNQYFCDTCNSLQDARRSLLGCDFPSCLVLTLCRFSYNSKAGKNVKLRTPVSYPEKLVLKDKEYSLNAVVIHSGTSLDGGHYYTYARSLNSDSQWYLFNDVRVTACTSPSKLAVKSGRPSCDTPYILFYTDSLSISEQLRDVNMSAISTSLRHLVVKDNLDLHREVKVAEEKKAARKTACQPSTQVWYAYTGDDDDDELPPGADNSLDLSGSRFIY